MKTCYIFAAGDFRGSFRKKANDLVIAADAGYRHLEEMGIYPDVLLGDFDTIGEMPKVSDTISFSPVKDFTDTELSIMEGIKRGFHKFTICGAIGGKRFEHTIANLSLAAAYAQKGYDITLTDGNYVVIALHNNSYRFTGKENGFISAFCLSGKAEGVNINGLKYTLTDGTLDSENPSLCVSNEFIGAPAEISVKNGTILIIWQSSEEYLNEA